MTTRLPMEDGEPFVHRLEVAVKGGDTGFIEASLPRLEKVIARYQDRICEIVKLQQWAREIRDQHESPMQQRLRRVRE